MSLTINLYRLVTVIPASTLLITLTHDSRKTALSMELGTLFVPVIHSSEKRVLRISRKERSKLFP
jgi:hypothetical protein